MNILLCIIKPWLKYCRHPLAREFRRIQRYTIYKDVKPKKAPTLLKGKFRIYLVQTTSEFQIEVCIKEGDKVGVKSLCYNKMRKSVHDNYFYCILLADII